LAAISSRLQRDLNTAAEQVNTRNGGDASHAIAARLRAYQVERVAWAQCGNQVWCTELKRDATWG
jgi:hypothetical protein